MRIEAAKIWNECIKISREYSKQNEGKWIHRFELQKIADGGKYDLLTVSGRMVTYKYIEARDATKVARKTESKIKYPYKYKKIF